MSRATVTTFGRGVSFVASGETGTQANEFEAAIKSVTSATTVGAVFIYDTRNDSDGGAWRKKARGSWYYETLNTATRGGRREFPSVALIVADNASANTVTIYDLDDPSAPMWMVFNAHTAAWETNAAFVSTSTLTSVHALNGRMYVGGEYGLVEIDFITEQQTNFRPISSTQRVRHKKSGAIVDRNDTSGQFRITATPIVNNNINDVAAKIAEGAEIGALGLPIPTVAVATGGGVSVIHPNGSVYDSATTEGIKTVDFKADGSLVSTSIHATASWFLTSNKSSFYANSIAGTYISQTTHGSPSSYRPNFLGGNPKGEVLNDGVAIGTDGALNLYKYNDGNPEESAVAYVTSSYNTGYMLGDIRFAGLANGGTSDRSVKGNHLTTSGSIAGIAVATNAELVGFSGFTSGGSGNHLARGYDADFDFGTGDFSVTLWAKWSGSGTKVLVDRGSTARFLLYDPNTGKPQLYVTDGSTNASITTANVLDDGSWHQIIALRRNSKLEIYVDGKDAQSTKPTSSHNLTDTNAILKIGVNLSNNDPFDGSLSLVRISATAPTPTQVADIYEAEKPLFRAGAKCLLKVSSGETHGSPSAVNDLSYDDSTGLLWTSQNSNLTSNSVHAFRGLERVDTFDLSAIGLSGNTQHVAAQSGIVAPVREASSGGAGVSLPAVDVRGDINTADTKLPDDGKFHFSGVTASTSTPTVIGHIPIAIGEKVTVKARVQASVYNITSLNGYYEEVTMTFQRPYDTGTVAAHTAFSNPTHSLNDTTIASLDVELNANDTAKTCEVKVTGSSAYRMQWNAEVEVQRISEKTYER